jgi:ribosomal protein S18 acetylase RimI-like enzyme
MPKFRKIKAADESKIKILLQQLTSNEINFDIETVLQEKNCHCVVLEDQKKIIGFAALVLCLVPCKGYVGWVEDVVVDKNYRGQGLGKKLMLELLKIAKKQKLKMVDLSSKLDRLAARKLYESLGFELRDSGIFRLKL